MRIAPVSRASFLVVRLSSFGDIILAEPVTRRLRQAYPDSRIDFAVYGEYAELPTLFPAVDGVVVCSRTTPSVPAFPQGFGGPLDAVIDLHNNARSRLLAARVGARRVLRYRRPYIRRLLAVYLPWAWKGQLRHTIDLYLDALRPLEIEPDGDLPRLVVPPGAIEQAAARLGKGPVFGLCPGASSPWKMWGARRFGALADMLVGQGSRVVIVGSRQDTAAVREAARGLEAKGVVTWISDSARELAGVLAGCEVVVSNDSGLLHLAAGVGSRVVAVYGPTAPLLGFEPRGVGARLVWRGLGCSPCSYHGNRPCRYARVSCLEDITPSEVTALVKELAAERSRA